MTMQMLTAAPIRRQDIEDAPLNAWVNTQLEEKGLAQYVPGYPNFNWMSYVRAVVKRHPVLNKDADLAATRIFENLFVAPETDIIEGEAGEGRESEGGGSTGKIWAFDPNKMGGTKDFVAYFKSAATKIALTLAGTAGKREENIPTRSIAPGRGESDKPSKDIPEGSLGGSNVPNVLTEVAGSEVWPSFRSWLMKQRGGAFLVQIISIMLENPGISQKDIAEELNEGTAEEGLPAIESKHVNYALTLLTGQKGAPGMVDLFFQDDPDMSAKIQRAKIKKQAPTPQAEETLWFPDDNSNGVPIIVKSGRGMNNKSVTFVVKDTGERHDRIPKVDDKGRRQFNF